MDTEAMDVQKMDATENGVASNVTPRPSPVQIFQSSSSANPTSSEIAWCSADATPTSAEPQKRASSSPPINVPPNKRQSLADKMQETQQADDDSVEIVEVAAVEGVDDKQWHLIKPTTLTSKWWGAFMKFNPNKHPGMQDQAACNICFEEKKYTRGTVMAKAGSTSGLSRHYQTHHRAKYEEITSSVPKPVGNKVLPFHSKPKEHYMGVQDIKRHFQLAGASWCIDCDQPFSQFEQQSFRNMFLPLNKHADQIVNTSRRAIREKVYDLGRYTEQASYKEICGRELAWTTDHWTGPNDETYSDVTGHWISDDWVMNSALLDFKVFKGTTTGEAIYLDIEQVLAKFQGGNTTVVLDTIGITDTTGNMGKLGQYCRNNGRRHGYCTDHNFHRNAIKAFKRKLFYYFVDDDHSYLTFVSLLVHNSY